MKYFPNSAERIDVCHGKIHPCIGCVQCGYEGPCVQKDDVELIRQKLLAADMVVFATPLYYYSMSAQLKTVVDRFCAFNSSLNSRRLKSAPNFCGRPVTAPTLLRAADDRPYPFAGGR